MNDSSELMFAVSELFQAAMEDALQKFPAKEEFTEKVTPEIAKDCCKALTNFMREGFKANNGYGSWYSVSFASAKNEDEAKRGILTLWDRYTSLKGFCIQFDRSSIKRLIESEIRLKSYEYLGLHEVKYGIDQSDTEFKELVSMISNLVTRDMLIKLKRFDKLDHAFVQPNKDSFARKLFTFCYTHKDPQFVDEREVRIIASPHNKAISEPLSGLKTTKEINSFRQRKSKYIVLGNSSFPGIRPRRIVIGPKTSSVEKGLLLDLWPPAPTLEECGIPIR